MVHLYYKNNQTEFCMEKTTNNNKSAGYLALLFTGTTILLAVLFFKEYSADTGASLLGRVPLLIVSIVLMIVYVSKYFKHHK